MIQADTIAEIYLFLRERREKIGGAFPPNPLSGSAPNLLMYSLYNLSQTDVVTEMMESVNDYECKIAQLPVEDPKRKMMEKVHTAIEGLLPHTSHLTSSVPSRVILLTTSNYSSSFPELQ